MTERRDSKGPSAVARENPRRDTSRALAEVTAEARRDSGALSGAAHDRWEAIDKELFARIDRDEAEVIAAASFRGSRGAWGVLAAITAAAAAILVVTVGDSQISTTPEASSSLAERTVPSGGSHLSREERAGGVLINGIAATRDRGLAAGDTVETHGGRAIFVDKPAVTWSVESTSRISVTRSGSPLVLTLERGAVEAQVSPVERGEAFAVDIDGTRVAVHGTHLRVERNGDRVSVDLTEGMISIGTAPRSGSTYGSLVTAPAHVEFRTGDPRASMRVDHLPSLVRAPISLSVQGEEDVAIDRTLRPPTSPTVVPATRPVAPVGRVAPVVRPRPAVPAVLPAEPPVPLAPRALDEVLPAASAPPEVPPAPRPSPKPPETGVAGTVRACWSSFAPPPGAHPVAVQTTLTVESADDGSVRLTHFDPPLPEAVQRCASEGIYKTRFAGAARIVIPIELTR